MCTAQRGLNNLTLAHGEFIQRKFPISIQAGCSRRKTLNTNTTGQVKLKLAPFGQNHPTLNDILQLAYVAGPIVALQFLHVELGQARTRNSEPAGGLFDKVISKGFDIFEALSQRRNFDGENAKTVIEVEAKTACLGLSEEITIGGGYETNPYRSRCARPPRAQIALPAERAAACFAGRAEFPRFHRETRCHCQPARSDRHDP